MKNELLFDLWPYAAALLFALGLAVRVGLEFMSGAVPVPERRTTRGLLGQRHVWHYSLVLIFLGHGAGLLFPQQVLLWNSVALRLYTLEALVFAATFVTLAGCAGLMLRRLESSEKLAAEQVAESIFLTLLFVTVLSGLLMAALYRWGSSWGVLTLTPYAISVMRGHPATELVAEMPFLVQLHVFSSVTLLAVFPFSRVVPPCLSVLRSGVSLAAAPFGVVVEFSRRFAQGVIRKHNPSLWIWPEED